MDSSQRLDRTGKRSSEAVPENYLRFQNVPDFSNGKNGKDDVMDFDKVMVPGSIANNN